MYVKPKKKLGQNFLIDKNIQRKIIEACELKPSDNVLEIGAGRGELTRLIADKVDKVYALEIDPYLCEILKDNLKAYSNVTIINQDILRFNFKRYFRKLKNEINPALVRKGGVKVIGNIPYYIATPIIEYLLQVRDKIDTIFITVQKEFARRVTATAGSKDYGSLSCYIQYYIKPKAVFYIKRTCFLPQPKIDSCLLRLDIKQKTILTKKQEKLLFRIIRAAFNKRRKTLKNSLKGVIPQQKLTTFFRKYNIDPNIRPERLALQEFKNLADL